MVNDDTFEYLTEYLYDRISPSVKPGYGEEDNSPKKNKEAELCDLFEHYTYMNGDGALLMSDSGVLYVYNGKYYEKVTTETFFNEVIKTVLSRMQVSKRMLLRHGEQKTGTFRAKQKIYRIRERCI